jgi:hypothetical protein
MGEPRLTLADLLSPHGGKEPPASTSASWLPVSTTRPRSITQIVFACAMVLRRCAIRITMCWRLRDTFRTAAAISRSVIESSAEVPPEDTHGPSTAARADAASDRPRGVIATRV